MPKVSFSVHTITAHTVFITDDKRPGTMSVTNAAEEVTKTVYRDHGDRRIVYRDTMGRWDELKHLEGHFLRFEPYFGWKPPEN